MFWFQRDVQHNTYQVDYMKWQTSYQIIIALTYLREKSYNKRLYIGLSTTINNTEKPVIKNKV